MAREALVHHHTAQAPHTAGHVIHWARWYDRLVDLVPFLRRGRRRLLELAAPAPGERVLDVGCGPGTLALAMKERVGPGEVFGIDASPEMIEVAQEKAARAGAAVDFRVVPIEALPFPDATFDLVTSSLMLHHLDAELKRRGLAQVRRVLKPGGRFVVMDFASRHHSLFGHVFALFGRSAEVVPADELTQLLTDAGLTRVEVLPALGSLAFVRARP